MAEERPAFWEQALDAYRDIEISKRNQPQLVQGIQQVQTPLSRNNDAVVSGLSSSRDVIPGNKTALYIGAAAAMLGIGFLVFKKKR